MSSHVAGENGDQGYAEPLQPGITAELNELIAMCRNGAHGYQLAGDRVEAEVLRTLFAAYAQQRSEFASVLQTEVARLGSTPETGGDLAGALHRLWIRIKRVFGAGDAAIVAECLAGDAAALEVYEDVRKKLAAGAVEDLVEQQYEAIRAARDRLQALQARIRLEQHKELT
jgi:uncharacterized protein (TIGR02284 family)